MTWERRYRLWHATRTSLVPWAALSLVAAVLCGPAVRWVDESVQWKLFGFSPDGARAVLSALVGSMLTFIVFVLSATLIVVQLASGQLTPRVIALVLARPGVKIALGTLTFTFAYTLAALGRIEDRVLELNLGIAVILNLACIIVFFMFVQRLSTGLRPGSVMLLVAEHAERVIEQVYPTKYDPKFPEEATTGTLPGTPSAGCRVRRTVRRGYGVQSRWPHPLAQKVDAIIDLGPQVGDSVSRGDPLIRVFGGTQPLSQEALGGCVAVGTERTLEQDPRFAFRILVDIANKALSPAINDPTTAVMALEQIDHLLLCLGRRRLDEGVGRDHEGKLRVVYCTPDWPDYVTLAIAEIRQYGDSILQVVRRLQAMLQHLIGALPESRRPPLQQELVLLASAVKRRFPDEEDRMRAGVADYQGVGGSDS